MPSQCRLRNALPCLLSRPPAVARCLVYRKLQAVLLLRGNRNYGDSCARTDELRVRGQFLPFAATAVFSLGRVAPSRAASGSRLAIAPGREHDPERDTAGIMTPGRRNQPRRHSPERAAQTRIPGAAAALSASRQGEAGEETQGGKPARWAPSRQHGCSHHNPRRSRVPPHASAPRAPAGNTAAAGKRRYPRSLPPPPFTPAATLKLRRGAATCHMRFAGPNGASPKLRPPPLCFPAKCHTRPVLARAQRSSPASSLKYSDV